MASMLILVGIQGAGLSITSSIIVYTDILDDDAVGDSTKGEGEPHRDSRGAHSVRGDTSNPAIVSRASRSPILCLLSLGEGVAIQ